MSVTQMYIVYYNTGRYGAAAVSYVFSTIMPSLVDSSSSSSDTFVVDLDIDDKEERRPRQVDRRRHQGPRGVRPVVE